MKKLLLASTLSAVTLLSGLAHAADYNVDREGAHAAVDRWFHRLHTARSSSVTPVMWR